jgi:hypothetical protein
MHVPKNYLHDRIVLLLLSVNTFLVLLCTTLILLKLDFGRGDGYIVQYRSNLGLEAFRSGNASGIFVFALFALLIYGLHTVISIRTYHTRRHFSYVVLGMAFLLLAIAVIVSNALIEV